jgi:TPP-dependent trihydroxycyclohexane-1,2-dione (THcHDO) dehydratase
MEKTSVNDQVIDAIKDLNSAMAGDADANVDALSYQLMAHSVALAMQNTVHQQQQAYVLQNAATTAAVKAIMESDPKEAIELAKQGFGTAPLVDTLKELKGFMDDLRDTYGDVQETVKATRSPAKTPARKRRRTPKKAKDS